MSRLMRYNDTGALDSAVLDALRQGIQHTVLSRTRLRKGGQAQKVHGCCRAQCQCAVDLAVTVVDVCHQRLTGMPVLDCQLLFCQCLDLIASALREIRALIFAACPLCLCYMSESDTSHMV